MANSEAKGSVGTVLIVMIVLGALGGWNYHRNYQTEVTERGPNAFSGYSDDALEGLRGAYQSEIDGLSAEFNSLKSRRVAVRKTTGVGDGVEQFERAQNAANRLRNSTTEVATREARVREIEEEQRYRSASSNAFALHFKRLTGIPLPI